MKQFILLLTGMLMIAIPFNAQTIKGKVTDEMAARDTRAIRETITFKFP